MAVPNTQHMQSLLYLVPALAVLGLIVMAIQATWVRKQDTGSARMSEIAQHIHEGALAFLSAEYRILAIFVVVKYLLEFFASFVAYNQLVDTTMRVETPHEREGVKATSL